MTCNCNLHRATSMTTGGLLTLTNSNNIANLTPFDLVLCLNPSAVVLGAPVNFTLTINGTTAELKNRVGLPISSDHLQSRKVYRGYYIVPETGTPYVILLNTPCDLIYALSSASVALTSDETTTEGD